MYLIDVYRDPYAGTEKQLFNLIQGLDRSHFEPALTLFRPSAHIDKNGFPCPVNILHINRLFSLATLVAMVRFALTLRKNGYRLVHIFFNDASLIAPLILKAAGIRVIISRRDMGFWYTPARLAILRFNRFFIDRAVVNSDAVKRVTGQMEHIPADRIEVIYNGYASEVTPASPSASQPTLKLRQGQNRVIGIVANIRPVKRVDDLVRAFRQVQDKHPDTDLVIIGSGDSAPLAQLARDLGISAHVHFPGAQSEVIPLIRQFDVAVLCSDSEGLSNAIIEYIQCGIPVVCTDTGGNNELVIDGQTGYLVPVGAVDRLAEQINMVLDNPGQAAAMAQRASVRIAELCNLENMLARHAVLYNALVQS
jgi:glycosyltransferase involved in cell wall biosynthesis